MQIKKMTIAALLGGSLMALPALAQDAADAAEMADQAAEAVAEHGEHMHAEAAEQVEAPAAEAMDAAAEEAGEMATEASTEMGEMAHEAGEHMHAEGEEHMSADSAEPMAEMMDAEAAPSGPEGMWLRDNGNQVKVEFRDGAMYCTIINRTKRNGKPKKDFEMCHGMTANGDTWTGRKMKHPEMPGFMTFKGTVSMADDVLSIKGCAVGVCDSESWTRMPEGG